MVLDLEEVHAKSLEVLSNDPTAQKLTVNSIKQLKSKYSDLYKYYNSSLDATFQNVISDTTAVLKRLDSSCDQLSNIDKAFEEISHHCGITQQHFKNFKLIQQVARARKNIKLTMKVQKSFSNIAELATQLLEKIENDSDEFPRLRKYYLELRNLMKIRDAAIEKLETLAEESKKPSEQKRAREQIEELEGYFQNLQAAAQAIERRIQFYLADPLYWIEDYPNALLQTLIICEFEDRKPESRILNFTHEDWMQWHAEEDLEEAERSPSPTRSRSMSKNNRESMKSKVLKEMEQRIQDHMAMMLVFGGDENLLVFQQNANEVLRDLQFITHSMGPVFPPHYEIVSYCVQRYLKFLKPQLFIRLQETQRGSVDLVRWVNEELLTSLRYIQGNLDPKTASEIDDLMTQVRSFTGNLTTDYVSGQRKKVTSWVQNIVRQERRERDGYIRMLTTDEDEEQGREGKPYTYAPIDLFGTALNSAWNEACTKHEGKMFKDLIQMILEVLDVYRRETEQDLRQYYLLGSTKYLVAHVNNGTELQQKILEKKDTIIDEDMDRTAVNIEDARFGLTPSQHDEIEELFDTCMANYADLSTLAGEILVKHIVEKKAVDGSNIAELFERHLFLEKWTRNTAPYFISDIVEYLGELFFDEDGGVGSWINNPNTAFSVLVKVCSNVVDLYFEQLVQTNRLKIKHIKVQNSSKLVCKRLHEDADALAEVFTCDNFDLGKLQRRYQRSMDRQNKVLKAKIDKIRKVGDLFSTKNVLDQLESTLDVFGEETKTIVDRVLELRSMKKDKNKVNKRLQQLIFNARNEKGESSKPSK